MNIKQFCEKYNLPDYANFTAIAADYGIISENEQHAQESIFDLFGYKPEKVQEIEFEEVQTVKEVKKSKIAPIAPVQSSDLASILANAMQPYISAPSLNPDEIRALIKDELKHVQPRELSIKINAVQSAKIDGLQHCEFEKIIKLAALRMHLYLYGPAGTGKTQLAENIATALKLPFASISCSQQTTKTDLFGFVDAMGKTVKTLFRDMYENGGVFLFDEIDAGNANILVAINAALANGFCAFPDAMVKRHNDFICIAAANTYGTGASRMYIGRNQLDASTLNRFLQIEINYDENLEIQLFGEKYASKVHDLRKKLEGERVVLSMRNIANYSNLAQSGVFTEKEAYQIAVINGIPTELHSKI